MDKVLLVLWVILSVGYVIDSIAYLKLRKELEKRNNLLIKQNEQLRKANSTLLAILREGEK